jgi:hypothetical protein
MVAYLFEAHGGAKAFCIDPIVAVVTATLHARSGSAGENGVGGSHVNIWPA